MAEKYYLDKDDVLNKLHIAYELARIDQKAAVSTAIADINAIPASDVQPVKRGRWIISNLYAQCSECSVAYDLDTFQRLIPMNENVPRHCSYCGARMEQED